MTDETKQKVRELVDSLVAEASAAAEARKAEPWIERPRYPSGLELLAIAAAVDDLDLTMRRILSELRKISEAVDR